MFNDVTIFDATAAGVPAAVLDEVKDMWSTFDYTNDAYVGFDTDNENDVDVFPVLAEFLTEWGHPRVLITYGW